MPSSPKPCPFCGSKKPRVQANTYYLVSVVCTSVRCGAAGPKRKTKNGAIAAWNRRASEGK